jgi:hypothetical protein
MGFGARSAPAKPPSVEKRARSPGGRPLYVLVAGLAPVAIACHAAAPGRPVPVAPAPPPTDDGRPARGGGGGTEHAAALEELTVSSLGWATDRQRSLRLLLPDARDWLRVKFWGAESLVAFRYGRDHHAIVGGFVVHVNDETAPGECGKTFERWAQPWVDAFEVSIAHDPPQATAWNGQIVDIDSLVATTATLGMHDDYAAAYAAYPAWKGACLVLGVAVPARGELLRAKAVRDRFVAEVLPKLQVTARTEPRERY